MVEKKVLKGSSVNDNVNENKKLWVGNINNKIQGLVNVDDLGVGFKVNVKRVVNFEIMVNPKERWHPNVENVGENLKVQDDI